MPTKGKTRLHFTDAEQDGGRLKEHDRAKEREADRAAMRKDAPPPKDRKKMKRRIGTERSFWKWSDAESMLRIRPWIFTNP